MSISEPSKILTPWATSGLKNAIPEAANPVTGKAGYDQGFPAINMTAKEAGGIPPFGQDFNGIFYEVTNILRYMQAGGKPTFSSALAAAIGGYPKGALVLGDDGITAYRNTIASNTSNPNAGGAGWVNEDTAPTPPQFDNDTSLATTAFVQRALGNVRGLAVGSVNRSLTVADIGAVVLVSPGVTLTLPLANSVPAGSVIHFRTSAGGADRAIVPSGSDTVSIEGGPTAVLKDGDTLSLASNGSGAWINVGGVAGLGNIAQFSASLTANGYQKLPSGLIIQWGEIANVTADAVQAVTYPIAFPSLVIGMLANLKSSAAATNPTAVYSSSTSLSAGVVVRDVAGSPYATGPIFWIAIGY